MGRPFFGFGAKAAPAAVGAGAEAASTTGWLAGAAAAAVRVSPYLALPLLAGDTDPEATAWAVRRNAARTIGGMDADMIPSRRQTGMSEWASSREVNLTGSAIFNGEIHLNLGQFGAIVEHAVSTA